MKKILTSVDGIGKKKSEELIKELGVEGLVERLEEAPERLKEEFGWFKKKMVKKLSEIWSEFKERLP